MNIGQVHIYHNSTEHDHDARLSLTHTAHVHARGRPWTHVAAVARNNANADTACSCSKIHATPRTNRAELDLYMRGRACTCVHVVIEHADFYDCTLTDCLLHSL